MGKKIAFTLGLLAIILLSTNGVMNASAKPRPPTPPEPPVEFPNQNGLNYASTYWHFDPAITTDEVLSRDFTLFQSGKITLICLNVHWSYLEPTMGNYRSSYLDDVIRVCNIADQYGISVIVDFHTLMHSDSYTVPSWVSPRSFNTVMQDPTVKEAWLNMLSFSAEYLTGVSNIHSWHMMNEPYIGEWAVQCNVDEFFQLWTEMKSAIRQYSPLPVSIRFGADSVMGCFNNDHRIYDLLDYITVNWYESYTPVSDFKSLVNNIKVYGKDVMIGEYGYSANKDQKQYDKLVTYVALFKELGIKWTLAWMWRSDSSVINNPGTLGTGFVLCKNSYGEPRKAFFAITAGNI